MIHGIGKPERSLASWWLGLEARWIPASAWGRGLLHFWRERILLAISLVAVVVGFFALIPSVALAIKEDLWAVAALDALAYLGLLVVMGVRRSTFEVKAWSVCLILYALGLGLSLFLGLVGASYLWLFAFSVVAGLLIGMTAGIVSLGLNAGTLALVAVLIRQDLLPWARLLENPLEKWVVLGASFLLINAIVTISIVLLLRGLEEALERERAVGRDLVREREQLVAVNRRMMVEVGERIEAEQARWRSEQRYHDLFDSISDLVYTQDLEGRFLSVNRAMVDSFGYSREEFIGRPGSDFMRPGSAEAFRTGYLEVLQRDGKVEGVATHLTKHGDPRLIEFRSNLVRNADGGAHISGSARDVTERHNNEKKMMALQRQLQQAQKMEAVGTLAGGIAHDFNNILAVITGFSELALDEARAGKASPHNIQQVLSAADRAKKLIQQILTFSRKAHFEPRPLDLHQVIGEAVAIIERTIPKMIAVEVRLGQGLGLINGDPTQIEQILLNLASNAKDAMPEGGKLVIETRIIRLDQELAQLDQNVPPGDYALLTVSDTGQGMDQETMKHIFEPFYTTKQVGQGTGLGLATIYGIVKRHGGFISCQSEPGQGTTFGIHLPLLAADGAELTDEAPVHAQPPRGVETVLLVDDEEALREVGREVLEGQGYQVATAATGEEALAIYRQRGIRFDLVILDVSMPGMGGHKCLQELLKYDPGVKVVIATGYSPYSQQAEAAAAGAAGWPVSCAR
ncbi:MAG: response regulator [Desulfarculus sp.]|nr:response regulator [Desulfarculus sp.]